MLPVKELNYKILNDLDDRNLIKLCKIETKWKLTCNDDNFWLSRINNKYPYLSTKILNKYKQNKWSEYYISIIKINKNNASKYLFNGAKYGRLDWVIISIMMGADLHDRDYYGSEGALKWAAKRGDLEMVKYLVEIGASIENSYDHQGNYAALRLATDPEVIEYLISKK